MTGKDLAIIIVSAILVGWGILNLEMREISSQTAVEKPQKLYPSNVDGAQYRVLTADFLERCEESAYDCDCMVGELHRQYPLFDDAIRAVPVDEELPATTLDQLLIACS